MSRSVNTGVILAAGRGQRMRLFADRYPKPILPICNRPLIAYQMEMLQRMGAQRVIIVIGHLGAEIVKTIERLQLPGLSVEFHDQGELLGIAHAVGQLESKINGPFILFLGDIYFVSDRLESLTDPFLKDEEVKAVLAVRDGEGPEAIQRNFAVHLDEAGRVTRVIEKPHHPRTHLKGCGLYLFDGEIFDAIRRTQRTALRDEYEITDSIQVLIDDGYRVAAANNIRYDINLTFPEDILRANLAQLKAQGDLRCVHPSARVEGAEVIRSVVGEGARLAPGSHLEDCLVLPGVTAPTPVQWRACIATGDQVIPCDPARLALD